MREKTFENGVKNREKKNKNRYGKALPNCGLYVEYFYFYLGFNY